MEMLGEGLRGTGGETRGGGSVRENVWKGIDSGERGKEMGERSGGPALGKPSQPLSDTLHHPSQPCRPQASPRREPCNLESPLPHPCHFPSHD